jgi:hypothetical protein
MCKKVVVSLLVVLLVAGMAVAQGSAGAQSSASGSAQAQAKARKVDAKASADVSAKQEAQASKEMGKAASKADARGSAKSDASARSGQHEFKLESGSVIEAALTKSLDARKCKPGDEVAARVTKDLKHEGKVIVAKNSRLLGRVTEATARGESQSESRLGLEFDRVVLKDGRTFPMQLAIQAVAAAQSAVAASAHDEMAPPMDGGASPAPRSSGSSGGGVLGGVGSTDNSTVSATTGAVGSVAGTAGATVDSTVGGAVGADAGRGRAGQAGVVGTLTSSSTGVIGLRDLALRSGSVHESSGSVLVSSTRNVHLDSGTRFLLRSKASAGKQEAKPQQ